MIEIDEALAMYSFKSVEQFLRVVFLAFDIKGQIGLSNNVLIRVSVDGTPTQNNIGGCALARAGILIRVRPIHTRSDPRAYSCIHARAQALSTSS